MKKQNKTRISMALIAKFEELNKTRGDFDKYLIDLNQLNGDKELILEQINYLKITMVKLEAEIEAMKEEIKI